MFVADLHNDVVQRTMIGEDIAQRTDVGHSDLVRLRESCIDLEILVVWASKTSPKGSAFLAANAMYDAIEALATKNNFLTIPKTLNDLRGAINVLASETFSSVSAPIQYAAITAYSNDHSEYINNSKNILRAVGNYVYENLKSNKVIINKPQGGFYLMPEFSTKSFSTSSKMCDNLLKETGIALLPGLDFGFDEKRMLARLSFTDFNGREFMNNTKDGKKIDNDLILKFAPKIVEGVDKLKKWSESI